MALALALSVIATTGTGIVLTARLVYGRASYRTLPTFLANVSRRFSTPVAASVIVGFLIVGLAWVYLLTTSVQGAFNDVVARDRPVVRGVLCPHGAGNHDLLPAPDSANRVGRARSWRPSGD